MRRSILVSGLAALAVVVSTVTASAYGPPPATDGVRGDIRELTRGALRNSVGEAVGETPREPRPIERRARTHYLSFGYRPGERVADARFTDVDGKTGVLSAIAGTAGAVVVVRDAECPVSQRYAPRLAAMEKEYGPKGYTFLYVDATPHDLKASLADARKYGLTGRTVLDTAGVLLGALRATSSAEAFLIDAQGTLRYRGAVDDQYGITFHKEAVSRHWLRTAMDLVAAHKDVRESATEASGCMFDADLEAPGVPRAVTYNNRISRIVQQKCESCHRVDGNAPMPLQNYAQVSARREVIRFMTSTRRMPPWSANPKVGAWTNDASLTTQELSDLLAWAKGTAPAGRIADAPIKRAFTPGWDMGKPDAIVQITEPVHIPAQGVVQYKYAFVKTNFDSDKWISAMEIRATAPKVVHHVLVFLEEPGLKNGAGGVDGFFAATAPGSPAAIFPEGAAKKLPKGAWLKFQIHYQPNGTDQIDQTRIGLMFADDSTMVNGRFAEVESKSAFNTRFAIPPDDSNYRVVATNTFREPGMLLSLFPHTHLRGKAWKIELVSADSTRTLLLDVPRYDFNWQTFYTFKTPVRVMPGQRLIATAWYDNSTNNPSNPDHTKTVRFGEQTFEEMMIGYFDWIPDAKRGQPADTAKSGTPNR